MRKNPLQEKWKTKAKEESKEHEKEQNDVNPEISMMTQTIP